VRAALWSGAVLTGGRSTRMGRDKALLVVDGQPMAVRAADALAAAGAAEVFTVGGDLDGLAALGLDARAEPRPGEGPLAGLLAALDAAREAVVMVLACDLVSPAPTAIATVVDGLLAAPPEVAAAAPVSGDRVQVLHAAYRPAVCGPLRAAFDGGERAVHRALATVRWLAVDGIPAAALADADVPDDL
jgi:molybdopterin-guanine dinucleotide biosynthesis protein A